MGGISVFLMFGMMSAAFLTFSIVALLVLAAFVFYFLVSYIFEVLFLCAVLKRNGAAGAGAAWVPFYGKRLLGKIAGSPAGGAVLACLQGLCAVLIALLFLGPDPGTAGSGLLLLLLLTAMLVCFVLDVWLAYRIIQQTGCRCGDLLTVLNVFTLGLSRPIVLFALRNDPRLVPDAARR